MASLCKRQQCTIERRGFRQELDSWRHKLIHCVGKLSWHCVCASVWRGPGSRWVPVTVCICCFSGVERAVAVMSSGKPIGSHEAVIFFVTHGCCLALPASHRTHPKIFSSKFVCSCRACCQVFRLQTLCLTCSAAEFGFYSECQRFGTAGVFF